MITTFDDMIEHLSRRIGQEPSVASLSDVRTAILDAYREFADAHPWRYLEQVGRLVTVPPYSTGTIAFTHSTRTVTLTGGTWPTWARYGTLKIGNVLCQVQSRTSGTALVLDPTLNPGADIASGNAYTLFRDTYDLPADMRNMGRMLSATTRLWLAPTSPIAWLDEMVTFSDQGDPWRYIIVGSPHTPGRLAVRFAPAPSTAITIDYWYQRRPRAIVVGEYDAGTCAVSGATVTGTGTAWTSAMEGCVFRCSSLSNRKPTSFLGDTAPTHESRILTRASDTSITLADAATATLSGVKYSISDPIDIEDGAMLSAFHRLCEYKLSLVRPLKDMQSPASAYQAALIRAKEADARYRSGMDRGPVNLFQRATFVADQ